MNIFFLGKVLNLDLASLLGFLKLDKVKEVSFTNTNSHSLTLLVIFQLLYDSPNLASRKELIK